MYSQLKRSFTASVPIFAIATMSACLVSPAAAQFSGSVLADPARNAYFVRGDATLSGNAGNSYIFVGKDGPNNFASFTLPGTFSLKVASGAILTPNNADSSLTDSYGRRSRGISIFGDHCVDMDGGTIAETNNWDSSMTTILGGSIGLASVHDYSSLQIGGGGIVNLGIASWKAFITLRDGGRLDAGYLFNYSDIYIYGGTATSLHAYESSLIDVSLGTVQNAVCLQNSRLNLRSGTVQNLNCYQNSIVRVRQGSLPDGIILNGTSSKADFMGTGLKYKYYGYSSLRRMDKFVIYGYFNNVFTVYDLYLAGDVQNSTPRQFTFNGVAP